MGWPIWRHMSGHIWHVRRWTETDPGHRDGHEDRRDLQLQVGYLVMQLWDATSCAYAQLIGVFAQMLYVCTASASHQCVYLHCSILLDALSLWCCLLRVTRRYGELLRSCRMCFDHDPNLPHRSDCCVMQDCVSTSYRVDMLTHEACCPVFTFLHAISTFLHATSTVM